MMAAVLQLSVVRSILFFVTLVLWTDERYAYGDVSHLISLKPLAHSPTEPSACVQICGFMYLIAVIRPTQPLTVCVF